MSSNSKNPIKMVPDPFTGNTYVLPQTECTHERKLFFKRMNEIQTFISVSKLSFDICKEQYEKRIIPNLPSKENTPIWISMNHGNFIIMPGIKIIELSSNGIHIVTRQALVMFYGSFETYLYQLFEKSFPTVGISKTKTILDKSRDILMLKKWDGKFCKMNDVFNIGYKSADLIGFFTNYEMTFEKKEHKNPLNFLDELAQIRHRIVHASSILENGNLIYIDINNFHGLFKFFFWLTDYVDNLFAKRFSFARQKLDPAKA